MTRLICACARLAAWLVPSIVLALLSAAPAHGEPGDSFDDAIVVGPAPVLVNGTTCGLTDDVSDLCLGGTGSPDVFYRFTPDHDGSFTISTCGSWFLNNFVVYDRFRRVLLCRQSECLFGGYSRFLLQADSTYYIGIDGEYGACGHYIFSIDDCPNECDGAYARCTPGGFKEGEPVCVPGYVDHFNDGGCTPAGCNVSPVPCTGSEVAICGTIGRTDSGGIDTDVYEFVQESTSHVTIALASAHASVMAMLWAHFEGMDPEMLVGYRINWGVLYDELLKPGRYQLILRVDSRDTAACDNPTMVRFTGLGCTPAPTPAKRASWGVLKATYR